MKDDYEPLGSTETIVKPVHLGGAGGGITGEDGEMDSFWYSEFTGA